VKLSKKETSSVVVEIYDDSITLQGLKNQIKVMRIRARSDRASKRGIELSHSFTYRANKKLRGVAALWHLGHANQSRLKCGASGVVVTAAHKTS
jgi:hypothetical protein